MSMDTSSLSQHLQGVQQRISQACKQADRPRQSVQLLAVSKRKPAADIAALAAAGQRSFGENYLHEALDKMAQLAPLALDWHFIGPVQSNKTRAIAEHFAWVHSVDRIKLASRLSAQRPDALPALNLCVQVNISAEPSKSGVAVEHTLALCQAIHALPRLRLRGLMCIPAPASPGQPQSAFAAMRKLLGKLQQQGLPLDTLSMGMSGDLEAAIAEGATIVRVGTDLFGARNG